MENILNIAQIIVTVLLVTVILLQQRGTTLGGAFGGDSSVYSSRRGMERVFYIATIVLGIIFVGLAIVNIVL